MTGRNHVTDGAILYLIGLLCLFCLFSGPIRMEREASRRFA